MPSFEHFAGICTDVASKGYNNIEPLRQYREGTSTIDGTRELPFGGSCLQLLADLRVRLEQASADYCVFLQAEDEDPAHFAAMYSLRGRKWFYDPSRPHKEPMELSAMSADGSKKDVGGLPWTDVYHSKMSLFLDRRFRLEQKTYLCKPGPEAEWRSIDGGASVFNLSQTHADLPDNDYDKRTTIEQTGNRVLRWNAIVGYDIFRLMMREDRVMRIKPYSSKQARAGQDEYRALLQQVADRYQVQPCEIEEYFLEGWDILEEILSEKEEVL